MVRFIKRNPKLAAVGAVVVGMITWTHLEPHYWMWRVQGKVDEFLEEVAQTQERVLGLEYDSLPPVTVIWDEAKSLEGGTYHSVDDVVKINAAAHASFLWGDLEKDVKKILHHELVHYWCDQFVQEKTGKSIDHKDGGIRIIMEGIARYVEGRFFGYETESHNLGDCPVTKFTEGKNTSYHKVYCEGLALVRPIADRVGLRRGIEYMLENPPVLGEGFSVNRIRYVNRALAEIK